MVYLDVPCGFDGYHTDKTVVYYFGSLQKDEQCARLLAAQERCLELEQRGTPKPFDEVLREMEERDYQDTHRAAAPLKQAEDAVLLDTSDLNFEQSLAAMKKIIAEKVN